MGIAELWMPILASSVLIFIMSAMVWMFLPWHKTDFKKPNNEETLRSALNGYAPGYYMVPYCTDPAELKNDEVARKYIDGPQGFVTIVPNGLPNMAPKLILSFLYYLMVGVICAYFVTRTTNIDSSYLEVFRIAGATAWIAYGIAYIQDSVWFGRPWSLTIKSLFDALLYALLTGGVFGWLA